MFQSAIRHPPAAIPPLGYYLRTRQALAAVVSSGIIVPNKRMPIVVNAERVML